MLKRRVVRMVLLGGVALLVGSASASSSDSPYRVAVRVPHAYRVLLTENLGHGLHRASYGPRSLGDGYDAPLTVSSQKGGNPGRTGLSPRVQRGRVRLGHRLVPTDRATTVQGHPGVIRIVTDEGSAYGRQLVWRESADLVVGVQADFALTPRQLRAVAERVHAVAPAAWRRLFTETSGSGQIGHPSPSMRRTAAVRGTVGGHAWVLMALVPPHYPLGTDDRRVACQELRYRGQRSYGNACGEHPSWERLGGVIFLFGQSDRYTKRVRVRTYGEQTVLATTDTFAVPRLPAVRFYAVPLPEGTCSVEVDPVRRHRDPHLGPTGPLSESAPDLRRCSPGAETP